MPADAFSSMDSAETRNESQEQSIPTERLRTESESSDKSGSARFVLPGTSGSPPKVLTLDEVQDAIKNIKDMTLAHEIAINNEFKLQPYEPPENSLEKMVKDTMHKAYWEILREELNRTPPCYDHAIRLLGEIKEDFQTVITKNNAKALARINEILDEALIRQQAEQGVLDFKAYTRFIIHIMEISCAPIRDEQVHKLRDIEDTVELFRGIFETMSVMKLDLANCLLDAARNDVVTHSIVYEKEKFKKFLDLYKDGFPATEKWLKRNKLSSESTAATVTPSASSSTENNSMAGPSNAQQAQQRNSKDVIFNAYLELLDWSPENDFPEMLDMDRERIKTLQARALRLCTCAATLAVASTAIPSINDLKKTLANELTILLENCNTAADLDNMIENIWLHIKTVINDRLKIKFDESAESTIKTQILQISKLESPVRNLIWKRLLTYVKLDLRTNNQTPIPPGFLEYAEEIENFANAFKRISFYNYAVYGEYYHEILNKF
uniref:Putative sok1 kinase belonging to the ste20/sps1/gc kinase family n=1 Tax=Corethrella appendiculata TaxID=1370023 RepID=U5EVV9_9DIPT